MGDGRLVSIGESGTREAAFSASCPGVEIRVDTARTRVPFDNYCHFVRDFMLPIFAWLVEHRRHELRVRIIPDFHFTQRWQREYMEAVGGAGNQSTTQRSRVQFFDISLVSYRHYQCPGIDASRSTGSHHVAVCNSVAVPVDPQRHTAGFRDWVLRSFEVDTSAARNIVFVPRRPGRRTIRNKRRVRDALESWAKREGLSLVEVHLEDFSVREQLTLFSGARAVVGCHGAGMVNILFVPDGAAAVEVNPFGYCYDGFSRLVAARTVRFHSLEGEATEQALRIVGRVPKPKVFEYPHEIQVSEAALAELVGFLNRAVSSARVSPLRPRSDSGGSS